MRFLGGGLDQIEVAPRIVLNPAVRGKVEGADDPTALIRVELGGELVPPLVVAHE